MNWFFVSLPLVGLGVAWATIPHLVPAVRHQRTERTLARIRANGHGHLTASSEGVSDRP